MNHTHRCIQLMLLAGIAMLAGWTGCGADVAPTSISEGSSCEADSDCGEGQVCAAGTCTDSGSGSADTGSSNATSNGTAADTDINGDDTMTEPDTTPVLGIGDSCDTNSDCPSDYCIEIPGDGRRVCTDFCSEGTCPEEWSCSSVSNAGSDIVFLCYPETDFLCETCETDSDCGGLSDLCLEYSDGRHCARNCAERDCPEGYTCTELLEDGQEPEYQCTPERGQCADCFDPDNDGYGVGSACLGEDCNEDDPTINAGAVELCDNGIDNDCDGLEDEGFDITSDPDNCGGCGIVCEYPNAEALCVDSMCQQGPCEEGHFDNDPEEPGCEYTCVPTNDGVEACDMVDNDCDEEIDEGFDFAFDPNNCGGCNNACSFPNATPLCNNMVCELGSCQGAWRDLDGNPENGCEYNCPVFPPDMTDVPDSENLDSNCDGIDGVLSNSIFVATPANGGNDNNIGNIPDQPVATIGTAIRLANNCFPEQCDILVSAGTYTESITMVAGIDIYGGYAAGTWSRSAEASATIIEGSGAVSTIVYEGLFQPAILDGLTIRGSDSSVRGTSSYAVWIRNVPNNNAILNNCIIIGGDGARGTDGDDGANGTDGNIGDDARRADGGGGGLGGNCNANGGAGGSSQGCNSAGGASGQAGGDATSGGGGGGGGRNECSGNIVTGCDDEGGGGSNGSNGNDGLPGNAGLANGSAPGSFNGFGYWDNAGGDAGARGTNGGGGGGGGSGGADRDPFTCGNELQEGGGGGGGGGGGCGGSGGLPGSAGGGSFGLVLSNGTAQITNSVIELGSGGDGGAGGNGGDGGTGAGGGAGANNGDESGDGGRGGSGGHGGGGGGGSGGCGGPAIGVARVGTSDADLTGTTFRRRADESSGGGFGGTGGLGGLRGNSTTSRAPSGANGCRGLEADTQAY